MRYLFHILTLKLMLSFNTFSMGQIPMFFRIIAYHF